MPKYARKTRKIRRVPRKRARIPRKMPGKTTVVNYTQMLPYGMAQNGTFARALYSTISNSSGLVNSNAFSFTFSIADCVSSSGLANPFYMAFQMYKLVAATVILTPNFTVNQIAPVTGISTSQNNTGDWFSLTTPDASTHQKIAITASPMIITQLMGVKRHKWNKSAALRCRPRAILGITNALGTSSTTACIGPQPWLQDPTNSILQYGITVVLPALALANTSVNYWEVAVRYSFKGKGLM
jgi:hypothetical protein